jgi:hypothetical protein
MSKYVKFDQEQIKKDFPEVFEKYKGIAKVEAIQGVKVDLRRLHPDESVIYGDGKSFHFKLTKL